MKKLSRNQSVYTVIIAGLLSIIGVLVKFFLEEDRIDLSVYNFHKIESSIEQDKKKYNDSTLYYYEFSLVNKSNCDIDSSRPILIEEKNDISNFLDIRFCDPIRQNIYMPKSSIELNDSIAKFSFENFAKHSVCKIIIISNNPICKSEIVVDCNGNFRINYFKYIFITLILLAFITVLIFFLTKAGFLNWNKEIKLLKGKDISKNTTLAKELIKILTEPNLHK